MVSPEVAAGPIFSPPFHLRLPKSVDRVTKLHSADALSHRGARTAARREGLRYEKKTKDHLQEVLPGVELGGWWQYYDGRFPRQCQTDAIWVHPDGDKIGLLEIKRNHSSDSWWQIRYLYELVLKSFYGPKVNIIPVEVCRNFDATLSFPEEIVLVDDLRHWCSQVQHQFGVYRWRV